MTATGGGLVCRPDLECCTCCHPSGCDIPDPAGHCGHCHAELLCPWMALQEQDPSLYGLPGSRC